MEIRLQDLAPVMVRRLKSDLRALGEPFAERIVEKIAIEGLPDAAPELHLATMLSAYGDLREKRIGALKTGKASQARLAYIGLQQRLFSSIPFFNASSSAIPVLPHFSHVLRYLHALRSRSARDLHVILRKRELFPREV